MMSIEIRPLKGYPSHRPQSSFELAVDSGWSEAAIVPAAIAAEIERLQACERALISLESVARSHCRILEGKEPGYDLNDLLAYCDEALTAIANAKAGTS